MDVAYNPAKSDPIVVTPGGCQVGSLGNLAERGTCRRPEVGERVDALHQDESVGSRIKEADIGGTRWVARLGWQLESSRVTRRATCAKNQLLDPQVASVTGLLDWIPGEFHPQGPAKPDGDALESIRRVASAIPAFDLTNGGLRKANPRPELRLGEVTQEA